MCLASCGKLKGSMLNITSTAQSKKGLYSVNIMHVKKKKVFQNSWMLKANSTSPTVNLNVTKVILIKEVHNSKRADSCVELVTLLTGHQHHCK